MDDIQIIDDVFNREERDLIWNLCINSKYSYGERDRQGGPVVGLVSELDPSNFISKIILNKIQYSSVVRMYINCFAASEWPLFHVDSPVGKTVLYYPHYVYDMDEGGETQFLRPNDTILGVRPKPNRMVIFDSNLTHKATTYRSGHRFTVAIKVI